MQKLFELLNDERFAIDNFEFPDIKSDNVDFSLPENILANYNKLREKLVAYEAIEFQKYSKLGEALTKVFQKAIDYRDSLIPEMDKLPSSEKDKFLRKSMQSYINKVFIDDFKKAIKNTVNITVQKVVTCNEPSGMYAVLPVLGTLDTTETIWESTYRQRTGASTLEDIDLAFEDLCTITEQLDLKTGRMKSTKWGKKKQYDIYCDLYIDPCCSFTMRTYLPSDQFEELTARELAAIYLHEIGHMTSLIERSADLQFIESKTRQKISIFESADAETLCKVFLKNKELLIKHIDKVLSFTKNNKIVVQVKVILLALLQVLAAIVERIELNPDDKVSATVWALLRAFVILTSKLIFLTCSMMQILSIFITIFVLGYANNVIINSYLTGYKIDDFKTSDVVYTELDYTSSERDADEYTVRSGFGKEQVSGLHKLVETIKKYYFNSAGNRLPEIIRQNKLIWYLTEYTSFILPLISSFIAFPVEVHGRDIWRFEKMAQQTIKLFKEIPDSDMRNKYLAQYEGIYEEIAKAKKSKYVKLDQLNTAISNLLRPTIFSAIFGTGNLPNDYNKLREELESLMNNKMYYASAKLAQLADN